MAEQPRILFADSDHGCALWRNLITVTWWGDADWPRHERLFELTDRVLRELPAIGLLAIVEPSATPPERDVVKRSSARLGQLGEAGKLLANASVIQGDGLVKTVKRTLMSLVVTAVTTRFPCKVEGEIGPALDWVAPILGWPDAIEARAALEPLPAQLHERARAA